MNEALALNDVSQVHRTRYGEVTALRDVTLHVNRGELVALTGPSGSGKSTALLIASLGAKPTAGTVSLAGAPAPADSRTRAHLRNGYIGYVPQDYLVVDQKSAVDNACIPLEYAQPRMRKHQRRQRASKLLHESGLDAAVCARAAKTLSGGQKQRVAIARALVMDPVLILADEPTAALDRNTVKWLMRRFAELRDSGKAILIATHDQRVYGECDRIISMEDGQIIQ